MSTRIALHFHETPYPRTLPSGLTVVRLMATVRFSRGAEWSDSFHAIVDTGSPLSILPEYIWRDLKLNRLPIPAKTLGVAGQNYSVEVAEVECLVVDREHISRPMTLRAYLLHGDTEWLLVGMQDFLLSGILHCDYMSRNAYLEFP